MKAIFLGNFVECLVGLEQAGVSVCFGVQERGKESEEVRAWYAQRSIPAVTCTGKTELRTLLLAQERPDFLVSGSFGIILGEDLLGIPTSACLNLHPGYLPHYKGRHPLPQAILNGEPQAGVAFHYTTKGVDQGPILARAVIDLAYDQSYRYNEQRLRALIPDVVTAGINHHFKQLKPIANEQSTGSYFPPLNKDLLLSVLQAERISDVLKMHAADVRKEKRP